MAERLLEGTLSNNGNSATVDISMHGYNDRLNDLYTLVLAGSLGVGGAGTIDVAFDNPPTSFHQLVTTPGTISSIGIYNFRVRANHIRFTVQNASSGVACDYVLFH